jgi:hypothetical protein
VEREEQLSWERRVGRPVAIAAFASALLLLAALVYSSAAITQDSGNDTIDGLRLIQDEKTDVLITTLLQALSTALLAVPLWFLAQASRFRRPETPIITRYLALIGPPLAGLLQLVRQIQVAGVADDVTAMLRADPLSHERANELAKDQLAQGNLQIVGGLGLAAGLAIAFAFIMISLNAMRAGLLSRFMGILGIIVGVLFVIPLLGSVPIVEVFWVAALGLLFLGKWPQGGRGPAWDSGEAIPWPTAQDRQAELMAAREEREAEEGGGEPRDRAQRITAGRRPAPESDPDAGDHDGAAPQHPRSKKRKRKRR